MINLLKKRQILSSLVLSECEKPKVELSTAYECPLVSLFDLK